MSGFDADARVRRALAGSAYRAGVTMTVVASDANRWASATFAGARHEIVLTGQADDAMERWLGDLPEADLSVPGYLVADLKIVAMRQAGSDLTVTLEVLTVEDC